MCALTFVRVSDSAFRGNLSLSLATRNMSTREYTVCAISDYGSWVTVTDGYIYFRGDVQVVTFYKCVCASATPVLCAFRFSCRRIFALFRLAWFATSVFETIRPYAGTGMIQRHKPV